MSHTPFHHRQAGSADSHANDEHVQLLGDPMRHAWPNMNSSKGLQVQPNVVPVFGALGGAEANVLDDRFLTFQASKDIEPFECELLWEYDWEESDAPAEAPGQEATEESMGLEEDNHDNGVTADTPGTEQKKSLKRPPGDDDPGSAQKGPQPKRGRVSAECEPGEGGTLPADDSEAQPIIATGISLGRSKALEFFFHEGQIKVTFEKKPKRLPPHVFPLHSDCVRSTNEWRRIKYHLTQTTQIFLDNLEKKVKVKDTFTGSVHVKHVWGYEDREGGRKT